MRTTAVVAPVIVVAGLALWAWSPWDSEAPPLPTLDLSGSAPAVRARISDRTAAVRAEPSDAGAWARLAGALEVHGFVLEAVPCYERAAALDPKEWRWPYFLGVCLRGTDPEGCVLALQRAATLEPGHVPLQVTLGEALLALDRIEEAEATLEKARTLDPGCAPALHALAEIALRRGDTGASMALAQQAIRLAPAYKAPRELLAQIHQREGREAEAEAARRIAGSLDDVVPLPDPSRDRVWWDEGASLQWRRLRADQYRRSGKIDLAAAEWEDLLAYESDAVVAHEELSALRVEEGRLLDARRHFEAACRLARGSPRPFEVFGAALAASRRDGEAAAVLAAGLAAHPDSLDLRVNLGSVKARAGSRDEGISLLREAVAAAPGHPAALFNLGVALGEAGRHDEAADCFSRLAAIAPRHPDVFDRWAVSLVLARQAGRAITVLREGVAAMPDNATTANRLAWLLAAGPDPLHRNGAEALTIARGLCEASRFQSPVLLDTLAVAAAETGDFATARQMSARAVELASRRDRFSPNPALAERMRLRLEQYFVPGRAYHGPQ